jgi:hypothetical protein
VAFAEIFLRPTEAGKLELLAEALAHADLYALERGVTLLLEPINRYETHYSLQR